MSLALRVSLSLLALSLLPPAVPAPASAATAPAARGAASAVATDWWQAVSDRIGSDEYRPSAGPSGLQAPNRAQGLRTYFRPRGIDVVPRTGEGDEWRIAWRTTHWGRAGRLVPLSPAGGEPVCEGARVTYTNEGLSEWYDNRKDGLEQGFRVAARPGGRGALHIRGEWSGTLKAHWNTPERSVDFLDAHDALVLRYGGLQVRDAAGALLASRFELAGEAMAIVIDDARARYPITVDPVLSSPVWSVTGSQAGDQLGYSIATAGDVNGDGFSDVVVGAPYFDNDQANEGRACVYLGSPAGPSAVPHWMAEGDQASALFGSVVATAGDVNGDGYDDVLVGAPYYDNGQTDEGRALVYLGSATGLSATAAWTAESDQGSANFASAAGTAGDVNGDGFWDVIVGARSFDNGQSNEGRAFVYLGGAGGLAATEAWTAESDQASAQFGYSVGTAGDVNGDGYDDVLVGARNYTNGESNEGRAWLYLGIAGGLAATAVWSAEGNQAGAGFGFAVGTAGDMNGDGYCDIVVGAPGYDNGQADEGRAFGYFGAPGGISASLSWYTEGDQASAYYGCAVGTAGDLNGDGYADLIVGAYGYDFAVADEGRIAVFEGSAAGPPTWPAWTCVGGQSGAWFGYSAGTAGDVDGDGYSDLAVGAPDFDTGSGNEGRASVYRGAAAPSSLTAAWTVNGGQAMADLGDSLATAGDVNGDGYSDVIVAAPRYDNGQIDEGRVLVFHGSATGLSTTPAWTAEGNLANCLFGSGVGTAGDVNGDGYADVIVGAPGLGNPGDTPRAMVYLGSSSGLGAGPAWTMVRGPYGSQFGSCVGTAGDVNGDGYSDVIVGACQDSSGPNSGLKGRAYLYLGGPAGPLGFASWVGEPEQEKSHFGVAVGTAGDVNGDGFSDVIVSDDMFSADVFINSHCGRAYVYLGSATGLAAAPSWHSTGKGNVSFFGRSAGTAGDVNGDGYSDVFVGGEHYPLTGGVFVYHGSPAGLDTSWAWRLSGGVGAWLIGRSAATAGDVNGDGYSDLLVGCHAEDAPIYLSGQVRLYLGSASGLAESIAWAASGDSAYAEIGHSVATAGDVNGDGYSDILVGAPGYWGGRAMLYYGNSCDGLERFPRQSRVDNGALISPLGWSDSPTGFRVGLRGRTPAGRGRVRLQYEVKTVGTVFDGEAVVSGAWYDTGAPVSGGSYTALGLRVSGLQRGAPYHWRARTLGDSPFFPRSPWFSLPHNASNEMDVRTGGGFAGVEGPGSASTGAKLERVVPNPFVVNARVFYSLPQAGHVRLEVFTAAGRRIATLEDGELPAGTHSALWDGRDGAGRHVAPGVYFVHLSCRGERQVTRVVFLR